VIAGDFNEDPWGRAVSYLEQHGLQRIATTGPITWHYEADGTDLLKLNIDHVMVDGRVAGRDGRVLDAGPRITGRSSSRSRPRPRRRRSHSRV
jgi:endonuclease/exonuclease/phosphatase (EEP) superfamily protein YafD